MASLLISKTFFQSFVIDIVLVVFVVVVIAVFVNDVVVDDPINLLLKLGPK